ncbi:MAG: GNAT family N-acyltransferase [Planctomycetota bacterium]
MDTHRPSPDRPFSLPFPPGAPMWHRLGCRAIERVLDLDGLNEIAALGDTDPRDLPYGRRVLDGMGVSIAATGLPSPERIAGRPLVIVANHPFGGIEGLALDAVFRELRPDLLVMATTMLARVRGMQDGFVFVDNLSGPSASQANTEPMRRVIRWLREGRAFGVFPAGAVAAFHPGRRRVVEQPWSAMIGRIIKRTDAWVLPVCFEGRNRWPFHAVGVMHPSLRRFLLARELTSAWGRTVRMHAGPLIPPELWSRFADGESLVGHLRERTTGLRPARPPRTAQRRTSAIVAKPAEEPVCAAIDPARVAEDVARLPAASRLAESNGLEVHWFRAAEAPALMHEVGRLRELTFRAVGEGTGRSTDIDRFDEHYLQLVLWDPATQRVAGGYRLGPTDTAVDRFGLDGLYVHTLFELTPALIDQISPALELGRSFVVSDYQKGYAPLMLLWRGIGAYCAANPRYRRLFGPVSISADYSDISRELLVRFLTESVHLPKLAKLIRPRNPIKTPRRHGLKRAGVSRVARSLDEVNQLVREIERDGKPMPVLLRQYLKLNAKLLGFNVDSDFGDVVDGLMYVDLVSVDQRILEKYMGKDAAEQFLAAHHEPANERIPSGRRS